MGLSTRDRGGLLLEGNGSDQETREAPSEDEIFLALGNQRRRYVVEYLLERDGPADIKDLSRGVAALENDIPVEDVTHEQRKRTYIALHQNHLPHLEEMGFVDTGRSGEAIKLTNRASLLSAYLNPEKEEEGVWLGAEIGLTLGGTLLVVLAWVDLYPLVLLPDLFYAVALTVALAIITVFRCYRLFGSRLGFGS